MSMRMAASACQLLQLSVLPRGARTVRDDDIVLFMRVSYRQRPIVARYHRGMTQGAPDIVIINARVLTLAGPTEPRRGAALGELGVIENGCIWIADGMITSVEEWDGLEDDFDPARTTVIDAHGRVLMPAFVDCHTHACFAGERYDEFEMRLRGAGYLDILRAGGGIMATVRAVRGADEKTLTRNLLRQAERMAGFGSATIEVKTGYGLSTEAELKMLRAIQHADALSPLTLVPTFLGAHAIDPDQPDFIERTIHETLPAIVDAAPGIPCDAYCEEGAWSLADTCRLFDAAAALGCPLRVHADQFNALGMTSAAIERHAVSVDHLEATTPIELERLASSATMGVALPASGFQLDDRYAPARSFVDMGGALAIATNNNPGSAPNASMPFTIALACRKLRLSPAEAITAATFNAACVMHMQDAVGSIETGRRADVQVLGTRDERELGHELAWPGPDLLIVNGEIVLRRHALHHG